MGPPREVQRDVGQEEQVLALLQTVQGYEGAQVLGNKVYEYCKHGKDFHTKLYEKSVGS